MVEATLVPARLGSGSASRGSVAAELSWAELELNSGQLCANRVATGSTLLSGRVGGVRPRSIHQSYFRV